ncbi:hypothetical protein X777_07432 [Ooceraea biroi]|uniref:Uncharacterized protein n=1 Tax=Ooceraea biroi TaxID=2015173 RepID=A0A026X3I5_OOCBI|nr:hypothetical protein X777_07432 [Ooceraea biroi]
MSCLHYFPTEEWLTAHIDCESINDCAIVLPSEDDKLLAFRNYKRKERAPFVVYADLECTLKKNEQAKDAAAAGAYQRHRAFSVGYYVRCAYDESLSAYRTHRGEDCVSWFVGELGELARRVKTILASNVPMRDLTPEQETEEITTVVDKKNFCELRSKQWLKLIARLKISTRLKRVRISGSM